MSWFHNLATEENHQNHRCVGISSMTWLTGTQFTLKSYLVLSLSIFILIFLLTSDPVFIVTVLICIPYRHVYLRVSFILHLYQHPLLLVSLMIAILTGERSLNVVLICIFLMARVFYQFLVCLLTVCNSSFGNYLVIGILDFWVVF